jgi:hypothetical protein
MWKDLKDFLVVFLIYLIGFSLAFHIILSENLEDFRLWGISLLEIFLFVSLLFSDLVLSQLTGSPPPTLSLGSLIWSQCWKRTKLQPLSFSLFT